MAVLLLTKFFFTTNSQFGTRANRPSLKSVGVDSWGAARPCRLFELPQLPYPLPCFVHWQFLLPILGVLFMAVSPASATHEVLWAIPSSNLSLFPALFLGSSCYPLLGAGNTSHHTIADLAWNSLLSVEHQTKQICFTSDKDLQVKRHQCCRITRSPRQFGRVV